MKNRTIQARQLQPVPLILLLAACAQAPSETYGFIATLGNDTTSVERITRAGNHIVSDAVARSPVVVRRHWEATLAPDGTIQHWSMDTSIPNAPAAQASLHHEADFDSAALRLTRRTGGGTNNVAYTKKYAVTVPWNAFVYGTWELLFDMARTRPDSTRIGQYFFEGWDEGNIGYATVRKLGNGDFAIRSTGLAGEGVGHLDENGRMLSYSGEGTTYKQEVRRVAVVPDIDSIAARFAADEKVHGMPRTLSARDTSRGRTGGADIMIDYGRPLARGRVLLGELIPYDRVWRTGANAATQLFTSRPIRLGGVALDSGAYTLWTLPSRTGVQLIINRETGQWGTAYRAANDLARVPMQVDSAAQPVEQFTIRVDTLAGRLLLEWGTFRWSVPIQSR